MPVCFGGKPTRYDAINPVCSKTVEYIYVYFFIYPILPVCFGGEATGHGTIA